MTFRQATVLALIGLTLVGCKRRTPADGPTRPTRSGSTTPRPASARAPTRSPRPRRSACGREQATAAEAARVREALTDLIYFEYDSEQLTEESQERLRDEGDHPARQPRIRLRIEGHADERGSTEYNLALGQRRAESVRTFLGGFGIAADRLPTISYGKERPLVEGSARPPGRGTAAPSSSSPPARSSTSPTRCADETEPPRGRGAAAGARRLRDQA
jgi:peptidoglycan-associated lipoprotein